jgi:hypothetical protein
MRCKAARIRFMGDGGAKYTPGETQRSISK